ncbi:unnamed protein product, partial [Didymodactylos carnosus]
TTPNITDGGWSSWSAFGACAGTCGVGIRRQIRNCDSPAPGPGGLPCIGPNYVTQLFDGGWSPWSGFSPCAGICSVGIAVSTRSCSSPAALNGGQPCAGPPTQTISCTLNVSCPVDGQWGAWLPWSACSATCGSNSTKYQYRLCNNPTPAYGGQQCQGIARNDTNCPELSDCP